MTENSDRQLHIDQSLLDEIRNTKKEMELKLNHIDKSIFQEEKIYLENTQMIGNLAIGWDKNKIKKFTGVRIRKRIGNRDKIISKSSIGNTYLNNMDDPDDCYQSNFNDSFENGNSNIESMSNFSMTSNFTSVISQGNLKIVTKKKGRKKRKLNENNSVCSSNLRSESQMSLDN
jgi:hypothetical protein